MSDDTLSRRNFLAGVATTGTIAALANAQTPATPGNAVVVANHAVVESKPSPGAIKVVCAENLSPAEVEQIRSAGKIDLHMLSSRSELKNHVAEAEVILGVVDRETMLAAKKLKWVQTWAAGVESLPKELMEHPCALTNMQRVFAPVIAETAIGLLLGLTRGLVQDSIPAFKEHKWMRGQSSVPLEDLYRKTIGIVGMGGIGSETARRLHYGFSMRVLATDAKPLPKPEFVAELHEPAWLMEMAPQVDVLMSAAPLTRETQKMFNESVFRKMKPTSYFLNVSRGGLVDQDALVKALKEKWIRGAGLDVATPEPLPPESPLWDCPNLVITPHNSGNAPIRQVRLMALVAENVRRYSNGLPLLNVVDKARGY
ncbi:MAG: twin-arginine translocation signal domain-containing protein [Acidobacteria bacterium]|nr:twin-arginine translocation signal domain-containing protein [Acidobacteriota bacterium]